MTFAFVTALSRISGVEFVAESLMKLIYIKRLRVQDDFSISIDFRLSSSLREIKAFTVVTPTTTAPY